MQSEGSPLLFLPEESGVFALTYSSVTTACVFLSNGRWNKPKAVHIKPAESCWEEEEKTLGYPKLFGETHHRTHT